MIAVVPRNRGTGGILNAIGWARTGIIQLQKRVHRAPKVSQIYNDVCPVVDNRDIASKEGVGRRAVAIWIEHHPLGPNCGRGELTGGILMPLSVQRVVKEICCVLPSIQTGAIPGARVLPAPAPRVGKISENDHITQPFQRRFARGELLPVVGGIHRSRQSREIIGGEDFAILVDALVPVLEQNRLIIKNTGVDERQHGTCELAHTDCSARLVRFLAVKTVWRERRCASPSATSRPREWAQAVYQVVVEQLSSSHCGFDPDSLCLCYCASCSAREHGGHAQCE